MHAVDYQNVALLKGIVILWSHNLKQKYKQKLTYARHSRCKESVALESLLTMHINCEKNWNMRLIACLIVYKNHNYMYKIWAYTFIEMMYIENSGKIVWNNKTVFIKIQRYIWSVYVSFNSNLFSQNSVCWRETSIKQLLVWSLKYLKKNNNNQEYLNILILKIIDIQSIDSKHNI